MSPWRSTLKSLEYQDLQLSPGYVGTEVVDTNSFDNLETLIENGSEYPNRPFEQLPTSIRRLCGNIWYWRFQPISDRLLNLQQLELNYHRNDYMVESLTELLALSSPCGTTGQSVISEISFDFAKTGALTWASPEFCELTGNFSHLSQLLAIISHSCPALQVLRLRSPRHKADETSQVESSPSGSTAFSDRIVDIVNGCPSLKRIELPVRVASAQCQDYRAMPWLEHCRGRGVEVWCCGDLSSSSDCRIC